MRTRNSKECKEQLKFLDYLRKSNCTPTHAWENSGAVPDSREACSKTLEDMRKVAKECIEIKENEIKHREENEAKYYRN